MIRVKVKYQVDAITYLEVSGHANSGAHGQDIVCAGVSSLVLSNLMYAEKRQIGVMNTKQEDGLIIVEVVESTDVLQHILAAIVEGLSLMENQYPKYIKMKIWR